MRIRRLKLSGFKSFVEPVELRIEPGLTGVVGPNGCGKSNLLEAIRWVMGEGSPKSLRGGGMDDVIFAGTQRRPPRAFAEVSMLLERDGLSEEDGGEAEVTRRIEREAGSAYRLNGRDVRQKDVALLFADAATGAHSPALVSQGRIGAVIAAKPNERRQMLEEAAGIAGLHARRKDAEARLRATETNLGRLHEILADQEARATALRRQARVAERYRAATDRIRHAEARLLFSRWADADRLAREATEEEEAAGASVFAFIERVAQAQLAQAAGAKILDDRRHATMAARDTVQQMTHRLAIARAQRETVQRRIAELSSMITAIEAERAREEALKKDADSTVLALDEEAQQIAVRLSATENDGVRIAAALSAAEAQARRTEATLTDLLAREAAVVAERRVAEAALQSARSQAVRLDQEERGLVEQAARLGLGSDATLAREAARRRRTEASAACDASEVALARAEQDRASAAGSRDEAESALASAKATRAAYRAEVASLEASLATAFKKGAEVRAKPGFERALAAALGDDLDAPVAASGDRYWSGSDVAGGDAALPDNAISLAEHVTAPSELARRLRQIGIVDEDRGQALAVGQRLVTRAGHMRRWDGFVSEGAGAATHERLVRQNRLLQLRERGAGLESAVVGAEASRDDALARLDFAQSQAMAARAGLAEAERALREAARAEDAAKLAFERLAAQAAALKLRRVELAPVRAAAAEAVRQAERAMTAVPEAVGLTADIERVRTCAAERGRQVAECRAEAATQARSVASDRERQAVIVRERGLWLSRASAAAQRSDDTAQRATELTHEHRCSNAEPERLAGEIARIETDLGRAERGSADATNAERQSEAAMRDLGTALSAVAEALAAARETRAGAAARAESQVTRRAEFTRVCGEKFGCPAPLLPQKFGFDGSAPADPGAESEALERLTMERERLGPVNLVATAELEELQAGRERLSAERDELQEAIHRLRGSIGHLNREGRARLLEAFAEVDRHFRSLFSALFDGGQAKLQLVDSDDPLEAGLEILAQPPGKRLTALTLLSGGEQALTAVALIFSLFLTNPAPICVLDEVDAPLDDANVERFCNLLVRMTQETDTRYLIVTHNAVTMSRMDRLYGVTMVEQGVSRLVSVDLQSAGTMFAVE